MSNLNKLVAIDRNCYKFKPTRYIFLVLFWLDNFIFLSLLPRIESKHEVTILNGLNEFCVKFYGPRGSKYLYVIAITLLVSAVFV